MLNMLVSNRIESQVGLGKKKFFFFLVQSVQVRFFGPRFMPVSCDTGNKSLRLCRIWNGEGAWGGTQPAALFAAPSGPVGTARVHHVALGARGAARVFFGFRLAGGGRGPWHGRWGSDLTPCF